MSLAEDRFYNGVDPQDEAHNTSGLYIYDDRVLVRIKEAEERTQGGIIIPETHREKEDMAQTIATIITVGRFAYDHMAVEHRPKSGDTVLMAKYAGVLVKGPADGKPYRIVRTDDILARVEEKG